MLIPAKEMNTSENQSLIQQYKFQCFFKEIFNVAQVAIIHKKM